MPIYEEQFDEYLVKHKSPNVRKVISCLSAYLMTNEKDDIKELSTDDWKEILNDSDENMDSQKFGESKKIINNFICDKNVKKKK